MFDRQHISLLRALVHAAVLLGIICVAAPAQLISTAAGGGPNNMPAVQSNLRPVAIVVDAAGNYYVAVPSQNRVYRVSAGGVLTVFAGNGMLGFSGDGTDAATASL